MIKSNFLPKIDDRLHQSETVLWHVFYYGETFVHQSLSLENPSVVIENQVVTLQGDRLYINHEPFIETTSFKAISEEQMYLMMTNKPDKNLLISSARESSICIETDAIVLLNYLPKLKSFELTIQSGQDPIYHNQTLITSGKVMFNVGDQLVINNLIIENREKQFKLIAFGEQVLFNPWELIEEELRPEYPLNFPSFRRSPRIYLKEPKEEIGIIQPKAKEEEVKSDLLKTLVPPLGMVVLSGATSFLSGGNPIMMLSMGGASLLTTGFSISSYFTNRKEVRQKNSERENSYQQYLIREKARLSKLKSQQAYALHYLYPSMDDLSLMAKNYHSRIYERMMSHNDFLNVRLGEGEVETSFKVSLDAQGEDELIQQAEEQLLWPYQQLEVAPIISPLVNETVGLAGPPAVLRTAIQTLLFQTAILQSYHDVEFVTIFSEEDYPLYWKKWRWLPHMKLRQLNLRGMIYNEQTRDLVLNSFYQILAKRRHQLRESGNESVKFQPHYILSILDEKWLAGHGLNEFLSEDMSELGVTVIWAKDSVNMLPETTTTLVEYQSSEAAVLINQSNDYINQLFVPNHLPTTFPIEQAIQRIANLTHLEVEKNAVPDSLSLLEQYEVSTIEELTIKQRWLSAEPNKSIRSLIGWRGKSDYVYWDLHERTHGPHALVGGTTGSGKSEFLTTYLIGLAINFSPEDVGMMIIDWKGGGIANTLDKLPHFMGAITNLDGAGTARALASIKAELMKRQREFAKYGVNNINGYMTLYKQRHTPKPDIDYPTKPLPHLILVSDEFAELKANVPEFLDELTSVARIGRSLGVHLILATQKPAGVVNDQIEANSTSKIALKMASVQDSNELLKTPDAAQITNPGRGYLKVGENEVYELFQSGYAGVPYEPDKSTEEVIDERIYRINAMGQLELVYDPGEEVVQGKDTSDLPTQLEAVIQTIETIFNQEDFVLPDKPWVPPLDTQIVGPAVNNEKEWTKERQLTIPFGLMDVPMQQTQVNFSLDFSQLSHLAIYGSPGFGKSTALQTIVMNLARFNTPEQLHINLFDFGTNGLLPLKALPHVADIVRLEEEEKLNKFIKIIRGEIQRRKELFTDYGVASLAQYEEKAQQALPVIVTILDGFDPVKESPLEESIETLINQLLREGASLGMYIVMTALRPNSFRMNMSSNIPSHLGLFLVEEGAIREVVGRDALVQQEIIGRAQMKLDEPFELQVYLPAKGENDIDRLTIMESEIKSMTAQWTGERPSSIPMLPKEISLAEFINLPMSQAMLKDKKVPLALDKETTDVVGFNPMEQGYIVIGNDTPQQEEAIEKVMVESFKQLKGHYKRVVFDVNNRFSALSDAFDLVISEPDYSGAMNELHGQIEARQLEPSEERLLIYLPDIQQFADKSYISSEQLETYLRVGPKVGVYFIFQGNQKQIETSYDEVNKRLRSNIPVGMAGTRLVDQDLVPVKSNYSEPAVAIDEHHFFVGRQAIRVKLINM